MAKNKKKKKEVEKQYGNGIAPISLNSNFNINTPTVETKKTTKKTKKETKKKKKEKETIKVSDLVKSVDPDTPIAQKYNTEEYNQYYNSLSNKQKAKENEKVAKQISKQKNTELNKSRTKANKELMPVLAQTLDEQFKRQNQLTFNPTAEDKTNLTENYGVTSEKSPYSKNYKKTEKEKISANVMSKYGIEAKENDVILADYLKNYYEQDNQEPTIAEKILSPVTQAGTLVTGIAKPLGYQQYQRKDGLKTYLPDKLDLNYEKTGEKIDNGLGKFIYEAGGEASKILASSGINAIAPGAGTGMYWASMTGNNITQARNKATEKGEEATGKVLLNAAAKTGLEYITGKFLGSATKGLTGGKASELEKAITDKVYDAKFLQSLSDSTKLKIAKLVGTGVSEGTEETIQDPIEKLIDILTFGDDGKHKNVKELVTDLETYKDALKAGAAGALTAGMVEGANMVTNSSYYDQGAAEIEKNKRTKNEQKVIDAELQNRIATEFNGEATAKEIAQLQKEIIEDMEKGYVSTDTIERTLGGKTYKELEKINQKKNSIQQEIDELQKKANNNELSSLEEKQKLNDLKEEIKTIDDTEERKKLNQEIQETIKNDISLQESYKETGRRKENYSVDLSKVEDEKQRAVYQKAMDSGVLNNSNKTHALVDMIAKISSDKNIDFDFTNNERLEQSGFGLQGDVFEVRDSKGKLVQEFRTEAEAKKYINKLKNPDSYNINNVYKAVNGYLTKNGITINLNSQRAINRIVGHEITHTFEGTKLHEDLKNSLKKFAGESRWNELVEEYKYKYQDVEDSNPENELISDLVGDYLFTDENYVRDLSTKHKTTFDKIYDQIKYLYNVATAGSKEQRQLAKVKKTFDKMYNELKSKTTRETKMSVEKNTKTSISEDSQGRELSEGQQEYFRDSKARDENGNLMRFYHGSNSEFTIFDINKAGESNKNARVGFWFTPTKSGAENFARDVWYGDNTPTTYEVYLNLKNPKVYESFDNSAETERLNNLYKESRNREKALYDKHEFDNIGLSNVIAFLNYKTEENTLKSLVNDFGYTEEQAKEYIEEAKQVKEIREESKRLEQEVTNSRYTDSYEQFRTDIYKMAGKSADDANFGGIGMALDNEKQVVADYVKSLKEQGYDGIVIKNTTYDKTTMGGNNDQYVAFYPEQIKNVSNENPTSNADIRYDLSVSEAKTTKDNQGRKLTKDQLSYFKNAKSVDNDGNLITVYHTTTNDVTQFNEFNPVGTQYYRFGDQVVNYYTDDKNMSGSYADQKYKMADTTRIDSVEDAKKWLKNRVSKNDNIDIKETYDKFGQTMYHITKDGKEILNFTSETDLKNNIQNSFNGWVHYFKNIDKLNTEDTYGKIQYEGYVNITNPYVVDAEARNWNQVVQQSNDFIDELDERVSEDTKNNLTRLYRESANKSADAREIFNMLDKITYQGMDGHYSNVDENIRKVNNIVRAITYEKMKSLIETDYMDVNGWYRLAEELKEQGVIGESTKDLIINDFKLPEDTKQWLKENYTKEIPIQYIDMYSGDITKAVDKLGNKTTLQDIYEKKAEAYEEFDKYRYPQSYFKEKYAEENSMYTDLDLEDMLDTRAATMGVDAVMDEIAQAASVGFSKPGMIRLWGTSKTTNDVVKEIIASNKDGSTNYDGVIIKNVVDYGGKSEGSETPHDLYVTFKSNQFKAADNTNPTEDADIRYSLEKTNQIKENSEDEELSEGQKEYFKNSKAVTDDGRLWLVHHGTKSDFNTFDITKAGENGVALGNGFYFTNNKGTAYAFTEDGMYGTNDNQLKSGYVNIEKPASRTEKTMTYNEFKDLYKALNENPNMYDEEMGMSEIDALLSDYGDIYNDKENTIKKFYDSYNDDVSLIDNLSYMYSQAEMYKTLRDVTGYDGIIIDNPTGYDAYEKYFVTFNPDQFKLAKNENPTTNPDIRYSLTKDSKGRELSEEQQEYFRDSKVRDENGNLMPMYHGTPNGGFTVFRPGSYFSSNNEYANRYQNPGASSISYGKKTTAPKTYEVYLNITNPFDIKDDNTKKIYIEEFIKGNNSLYYDPYTSAEDYYKQFEAAEGVDWLEAEDLREWIQNNHPEYDGLIIDEGGDGGYGMAEYRWRGLSYMPFESNQVKNVDNLNPTSNDDIRYDLSIAPISKNFLTEAEQDELDGLRAVDNSGFSELTPEEQSRMYELENRANTILNKKAEKMLRSASYKAINTTTKIAQNYLDFDANQKKEFRSQMREFSNMTKDELVNADTYNKVKDIVSQYANKEYTYFDDSVESLKRELKHTKIQISDELKNQITDYGDFVKDSKLMLRRNSGQSVDKVYKEYSDMYPGFFDEDVWNEADQLEALNDFVNHDFSVTEKYRLTDEDLRNATDLIYNKLLDNSLTQQDLIETEEILDKKAQKRTRSVVIEELLGKMGVTPETIQVGKDISAIDFARTDPIRVNEKVFGWKTGQLINDATVNFTKHQEAERIRFLNKERQEIKDLGIKARSKESELVQKYGEKQYIDKNNEVHEYGDAELERDVQDAATREKIKNAARVLRQKYDTYIDRVNEVLTEMGYDEIPKRKDYMRHFVELDDKFSRWGLPFNKESMSAEDLPTDINGLTEFNRPGKSYFASANTRTGLQTTYDAITGIDGYLEGVSNLIYHTESIQRYRALSRLIRESYGREHGFDNIDLMTDEELAERIKDIQDNKLSKYVAWLDEQANSIAGKKGSLDRSVERLFGRRIYTALNTLKSQVGSNMTGFNVRSAMTNFASAIQGMSKTQKLAFVKGTISTINNIIHNDGMIEKSDFLTRRLLNTDSLAMKPWQKLSQAGQVFMNGTDYFTANQIWRSKYYENLQKGMSEEQAIKNADDFAARIMGDRSKGSTAELFNSKTLGFLSQFQLEVNNQWSSLIHDNKIDIQKGNKTPLGVTFELGQLFAASYLFNSMMKSLTGSDVMIDPIDMLLKIFKPDDDDEDDIVKRAQKVLGEFINQLPFANLITGGGRIPISEAFTGVQTLGKKLMGGTDNYGNEITWGDVKDDALESAAYWVLPTGYGQIRKTTKGLSMYDDKLPIAGSYTDSGNLRFSAEDTTLGKIKAGLFGQYSSKYAQDYIKSGYKSINASKLDEMKDLDMNSTEYRKYRQGLSEAGTSIQDKLDYISSLDVSDEDKTIMASNAAKKDIDMSEYKKYGTYEEFSYAQENPAKYQVMKYLGGYDTYKNYEKEINDIKADYDRNGKAITNSRKNKVIKYVNSLNLSRAQKAMLIKEQYPSFTKYDNEIASYVNKQNISYIDKASILKQLGFTAYDKQIINYIKQNYRTVEEQQRELEKLGFKVYNYNGKTYVR